MMCTFSLRKSVVLSLVVVFTWICLAQSAGPTGGTGCSHRWFFEHYCWRYCDASGTKWCYTGRCSSDEEECSQRRTCYGWCKDSQISEGCVVDCAGVRQDRGETTCIPTDSLERVHGCDNSYNAYPITCSYEQTVGITTQDKYGRGGSTSQTDSQSFEFGAGINIEGLSANFKTNLGKSWTTGNNWASESMSTYNLQTKHTYSTNVPAYGVFNLMQYVGRCGNFVVHGGIKAVSG